MKGARRPPVMGPCAPPLERCTRPGGPQSTHSQWCAGSGRPSQSDAGWRRGRECDSRGERGKGTKGGRGVKNDVRACAGLDSSTALVSHLSNRAWLHVKSAHTSRHVRPVRRLSRYSTLLAQVRQGCAAGVSALSSARCIRHALQRANTRTALCQNFAPRCSGRARCCELHGLRVMYRQHLVMT